MQFTQQHFDKIMQETAKNGGLSIKQFLPNGNIEKHNFNYGYVVSVKPFELKTKTLDYETLNNHFKRFDNQFNDIGLSFFDYLNLQQYNFIGVWRYRGYYYVDVNALIVDYKQALSLGLENKQKAIYDCKNNKTIKLTKNTWFDMLAL
jgi:hypothetical protein